ncbi:hypothetical protein KAH55_07415 [bacterium]|nr:hypothetical protein [bacterium]
MGGITLNEDNSHFYFTRSPEDMTEKGLGKFISQYAHTGVKELVFSVNSMRTSYASDVWQPIWKGYQPDGPDSQPLFQSLKPEQRPSSRRWVHNAWLLNARGLDPYSVWIKTCHEKGISPWLSTRMNDIHGVDDPDSFMHSDLWRERPDLRRVPYRFQGWNDRALDFKKPEVRENHLKLIRELMNRYSFDGLELDWMRFGFHFRPGHESAGLPLLTEFMQKVREMADEKGRREYRTIEIGVRVPSRPQTSLALGMDAITWARKQLVNRIVITPFWATSETDMPIELWRELLHGTKVLLSAGQEVLLQPYIGRKRIFQSLPTARAAAISFLQRGADRTYLFNFMDSQTEMRRAKDYDLLLKEIGEEELMQGKPRRHVVTYPDTWAPGEAQAILLPLELNAPYNQSVKLHLGPRPKNLTLFPILGFESTDHPEPIEFQIRLNGELCQPANEKINISVPEDVLDLMAFTAPPMAVRDGNNVLEIRPTQDAKITWLEFNFAQNISNLAD